AAVHPGLVQPGQGPPGLFEGLEQLGQWLAALLRGLGQLPAGKAARRQPGAGPPALPGQHQGLVFFQRRPAAARHQQQIIAQAEIRRQGQGRFGAGQSPLQIRALSRGKADAVRHFGGIRRRFGRLVEQAHRPVSFPRFQQQRPDHALFGGVGAGKRQAERRQQPGGPASQHTVFGHPLPPSVLLLSVCAGPGANIPIDRPAALCYTGTKPLTHSKGEPPMRYDFTSILDRRGKDSIAVDGLGRNPGFAPDAPRDGFDPIPMWVADMNFPTVPTVPKALMERASHPAYGYFETTDAYYDAIIQWQVQRNGCDPALLTRDCIGYENGVLGGVVSALTSLAGPGDPVLVHSPTYIGFTRSLQDNGFRIVHSPLVRDEQGVWRMDYADMDRKLKQYHIH